MVRNQKAASIDLGRRQISLQPIPSEWYSRFVGGRGLAAYLCCRNLEGGRWPDDPENGLVVGAGLLSGTLSAPDGYVTLMSRSPDTGLLDGVFPAGEFGAGMRRAGFDQLVITGRARHPAYLWLHEGSIEIRDGRDITGATGEAAAHRLCSRVGGHRVRILWMAADPGKWGSPPADDNLAEWTARVAGPKNLIAIACSGSRDMKVKDPEGVIAFEREALRQKSAAREPSARSDGALCAGPAGRVGRRECERVLAQCAGTAFGPAPDSGGIHALAERIRLHTGWAMDAPALERAAYRCIFLEHLFNMREGAAEADAALAEDYRRNGWTRSSVMKKAKVFDALELGELWPRFR